MLAQPNSRFLLASSSTRLVSAIQTALVESAARLDVAWSAPELLNALRDPVVPCLLLIDADLPGINIAQLPGLEHTASEPGPFPVILISDSISPESIDRLADGTIEDLIPPNLPPPHLRLRLDSSLRTFRRSRELQRFQQAAALNPRTDPLTGLHNRAALLEMLFSETDRVQRMNTSLCVLVFRVDPSASWNTRPADTACAELLRQAVDRVRRLLRSYDSLGRLGGREFALALPGCNLMNAVSLAERIRDVFSAPFSVNGAPVPITTGFGVVSSDGRSPVVVLRQAERALQDAHSTGPNLIRTLSQPELAPLLFPLGPDDVRTPTHT